MVANTMVNTLNFDEEFKIYINVLKPLLADMRVDSEKCLAARWVQKLLSISEPEQSHLKLVYLKLLVHCLVRSKLLGPFMKSPPENLVCLPLNKKFSALVEYELCEYSPCIVDLSADLLKYVAVQEMPRFGVHCYFAFSTGEKFDEWDNIKNINLLKAHHSATKSKWVLPPLPNMKPLPDLVPGDQEICDCDKNKALEALEKLMEGDEIATLPLDNVTPIAEMVGSPRTQKEMPWEKTDSCSCSPKTPSSSIHLDMTQPMQDLEYSKPRSTQLMKWGQKRKYIKAPIAQGHSIEEERLEGILEGSIRSESGIGEHGKESIYNSEYFVENPPPAMRTPPSRDAKRKLSFSESATCGTPCQERIELLERSGADLSEPKTMKYIEDDGFETPRPIYSSTPAVAGPSVDPGLAQPGHSRDPTLTHTMKKKMIDPTKTRTKKGARRVHGPLKAKELDFDADITEFLDTQFAIPTQDVEEEERMLEADALWSERIAEWDASGVEGGEAFEWMKGGRFDKRSLNPREQRALQKEFEEYIKERRARKRRPPQIPEPTEPVERFPEWVRDLQERGLADERGRVIPEYHFPDPVYPPSRHPQMPATPPLFRRGTGHRDRRYRPSEFGLTEEERWMPAEVYMRESIEPIFDPDERGLARLLRNIENSLGVIDEESITFDDLEDTIPDWERPSWPRLNLQSPTPLTPPPSTSTAIPVQPRPPRNFLAHVKVPDDMLDPYEFKDQSPEPPDLLEMSGVEGLHRSLVPPPRKKNFFDLEDLIEVPDLESFESEPGNSMFSSFEVSSLSSVGPIVPGRPLDFSDLEAFIDEKIEDISSYTIPLLEVSDESNFDPNPSLEVRNSLERHFQELKAAWQHLKTNFSGIQDSDAQEISAAATEDMFAAFEQNISDMPIDNISAIPLEEMSIASSVNRTLPSTALSTPKTPANVQAHGGMLDHMNSTELPPQGPSNASYVDSSNLSHLQSPLARSPIPLEVRDYLKFQSPEPVIYRPVKIPPTYRPPVYVRPENIFDESMDLVNSTRTTEDYDQSNIFSTAHSLVDSQEQLFVEDSSAEFGYKMPAVDRYKDLARRFAKIQSLRQRYLPLSNKTVESTFNGAAPSNRLSFAGFEDRRWPQLRRFSAPGRAAWNEQQPSNISQIGSHYSPNVTGSSSFNLDGLDVSLLEGVEEPSFYSNSEPTVKLKFNDAGPSHRLSFAGFEDRRWPQLRRFSAPGRAAWNKQPPLDLSHIGSSFNLDGHDVSLLEGVERPSFYSDSAQTENSVDQQLNLYMDSICDRENALQLMDILEESTLDLVTDYDTANDDIQFTDTDFQTSNDPFLDDITMPSIGQQNYTLRDSPKTPRPGSHSTPQSARRYIPLDYELPSIIRFEDSPPRNIARDPMATPRRQTQGGDLSHSIGSARQTENRQPPRRVRKSLTRPRRLDFVEEEFSSTNLLTSLADIDDETEIQLELDDTGAQYESVERHIDRINNTSYLSAVTEPTYDSFQSSLRSPPRPKPRVRSRSLSVPKDANKRPSGPRRSSFHYVPEQDIQNYLESNYIPQHETFLGDVSMPHADSTVDEERLIDMQLSGVTNNENISAVSMPLYGDTVLASSVRSMPGTRSEFPVSQGYRTPQRRARARSLPIQEQPFIVEPKQVPFWDSRLAQRTPPMRRRSHGTPESAKQFVPPEYVLPSPIRFEVSQPISPMPQLATPTRRKRRMGEPRRMGGKPKRVDFTLDEIELSQPDLDIPLLEDETMPVSTFISSHDSLLSINLPQSRTRPRRASTFTHRQIGANQYRKAQLNRSLPEPLQTRGLNYPMSPDGFQYGQFNYNTPKRSILKPSPKYILIDQESLPYKSLIDSSGLASLSLPSYLGNDRSFISIEQPVFEESSHRTPSSTLGQSDRGPFVTPTRSSRRRAPLSEPQTSRRGMQHSTPASARIGGSYSFVLPSPHRYEQSRAHTSPTADPYATPKHRRDSPHVAPRRRARRRLNLPEDTPSEFIQTLSLDPNYQIGLIEDETPMTPIYNFDNSSRGSARQGRSLQFSDDGDYYLTPISFPDQTSHMIQSMSPIQYLGSPVNRSSQNRSDVSRTSSRRGRTVDSSQDDRCCVTPNSNRRMLDSISPLQFLGSPFDRSDRSQGMQSPASPDLRRSPWHGIDSLEADVSSIHTSRSDDSFWR